MCHTTSGGFKGRGATWAEVRRQQILGVQNVEKRETFQVKTTFH